jgi:hypothetical protein
VEESWLIIEMGFVLLEQRRHVEEEQLEQYSVGTLPEPDVARVEEHILICETCQYKLNYTDSWVRSIRRVSAQCQPEPERFWHIWRLPRFSPALATAIVFVFVVGLAVQLNKQAPLAPLAVALEANRGAENVTRVPTRQPLVIEPSLEGLPQFPEYRLEVVDDTGKRVWQRNITASSGRTPGASISQISRGTYYVRLYSPTGDLLREYALEVRDPQ